MDIANILPDQVWSIMLEGESDNRFSQLMRKWLDPEFIDDFFEQNYNYIKNNPFYSRHTVQEVKASAHKEAKRFLTDFVTYYKNGLKGMAPDLEEKFKCLYRVPADTDSEHRRELYGYSETDISSVFRLYGIRVDSGKEEDPPGYVVTGGGIKVKSRNKRDSALNKEMSLIQSAQDWLKKQKLYTKEDLINRTNEHTD